jgi:hypothetical protein
MKFFFPSIFKTLLKRRNISDHTILTSDVKVNESSLVGTSAVFSETIFSSTGSISPSTKGVLSSSTSGISSTEPACRAFFRVEDSACNELVAFRFFALDFAVRRAVEPADVRGMVFDGKTAAT